MATGLNFAAYEPNNYCRVVHLPDSEALLSHCVAADSLQLLVGKVVEEIKTSFEEGVAEFVMTQKTDEIVVGTMDHEVAIFHIANKKKGDIVLHTKDDINCMSCSASNNLAVGTNGNEIHIVNLESKEQSLLGGHVGAIKAVAYDPLDKFLASLDSTGGLRITHTKSQTSAFSSKTQFPKAEVKDVPILRLSWHPQGNFLAVPGRPEVQLLTRGAWTSVIELKGGHTKPVAIVEFSPNGRYLASAGADLKMVVWDIASRLPVSSSSSLTLPAACYSITWNRSANSLAYSCANGRIASWDKPVSEALPNGFSLVVSATPTPTLATKRKAEESVEEPVEDEVVADTADEVQGDAEEQTADGELETGAGEEQKTGDGEMNDEESAHQAGGPDSIYGAEMSSEGEEEPVGSDDEDEESYKERRRLKRARLSSGVSSRNGGSSSSSSNGSSIVNEKLQPPFVSGSTSEVRGSKSKYYLLWNALGTVTSQDQDTYRVITTEYSEKSKKSTKGFKDHNGYTMCALGEHGAIFVSQHSADTPSDIFFQQIDGWGNQGDWHFSLPRHEDPVGCAIGDMWAVVATTQQLLRVFSYGGVQRGLLSVDGPLVTLAAQSSLLAVVWHRGHSVGGVPNLAVRVIDMNKREVKHEGSLPISPNSTLTWLSFVENGMLMSADSSGLVRGLSRYWGGLWCVVLDLTQAKQEKEASRGVYWPVTVMEDKLMVVDCRDRKHPYPRPSQKALLLPVTLQMPFIDVHNPRSHGAAESKIAIATLLRHETKASKKDLVEIDKLILQHINTAVCNDSLVKAQDLCTSLGMLQSLNLAVKIAENKSKADLVERMRLLIQARQQSQLHKPVSDEKDALLTWEEDEAPKPEKKRFLQSKIAATPTKEVKEPPPSKTTPREAVKSVAKSTTLASSVSPPSTPKTEPVVKSETPLSTKPSNPFAKKNPFGI